MRGRPKFYRDHPEAKVRSLVKVREEGREFGAAAVRGSDNNIYICCDNTAIKEMLSIAYKEDAAVAAEKEVDIFVVKNKRVVPRGDDRCYKSAHYPVDVVESIAETEEDPVVLALIYACRRQVPQDEAYRARLAERGGEPEPPPGGDDGAYVAKLKAENERLNALYAAAARRAKEGDDLAAHHVKEVERLRASVVTLSEDKEVLTKQRDEIEKSLLKLRKAAHNFLASLGRETATAMVAEIDEVSRKGGV